MSLDKIVEEAIRKAQERGDFEDLPGQGKPIDLTAYFDTPQDIRVAQSVLKNAGMASHEVDLLREIAALKQLHAAALDENKKREVFKEIEKKQIEFSLAMERQKRQRRQ